MLIVWVSILSSYYLRFEGHVPGLYMQQMLIYSIISTVVCTCCMFYFKLYNRIWQYASVGEMVSIFKAVLAGCSISYVIGLVLTGWRIPLQVYMHSFETILFLEGGSRFVWRIVRDRYSRNTNMSKALIIGAGACGANIVKELKQNASATMYPFGFIDDNPMKHRQQVNGITVLGGRDRIVQITEENDIEHIIIAIPSLTRKETSEIIEICKQTKAKLKLIPKLDELIQGEAFLNKIRDVQVEDLLGREPVKIDLHGVADFVEDKVVLVTGAGGSIGSELCRQISGFKPRTLLLLGHGENSIYTIEMELRAKFPKLRLETIIADVQDRSGFSMCLIHSDRRLYFMQQPISTCR